MQNTWILRRVYAPEPTPPGKVQRSPEELPNLMKLETVEYETLKPAGPLKVILLQDIEGVGHQFDVVDVDRRLARSNLLPTRKAVYASPFDLEYYAKVKEGIDMLDDAIFLNDEVISGPNFEIEARLIRFYVVCNFMSAIKIAHLALKHRQNRNHKMRIVMFIGSPIDNLDSAEVRLTKIAKKLKKEKVQCDVICFGEADSENSQIMGQFVDTLNGKWVQEGSGSNLLVVPAGSILTEALISSPVCRGEDGGNAPVVGAGGGFEFGVDPEDDPDLALVRAFALRVSMEEERARQAAEAAAAAAANGGQAQASAESENAQVLPMLA
ncbi:ribosomal protein L9 domain protein [Ancylostoma ceylanicum]|uniref:Ribosomal protein L9 domain protein n=1 Tax=Ancylostoma ceylanicum TaxID=53326 RepID=A0A0D6M3Z1_9BILA|nr:ribosomal protein L9 domain protein [Ancylostoma ceylanicum]